LSQLLQSMRRFKVLHGTDKGSDDHIPEIAHRRQTNPSDAQGAPPITRTVCTRGGSIQ
jgi:hypothetical protein